MINNLFAGLIGNTVFAYLDDLIIVSKDVQTHLQKLSTVLNRLASAGLKVKLAKCEFLKSKIQFLAMLWMEEAFTL